MNIMFKCGCKNSFYIQLNNLIRKNQIICPNCDKSLPKESLEALKIITTQALKTKTPNDSWMVTFDILLQ